MRKAGQRSRRFVMLCLATVVFHSHPMVAMADGNIVGDENIVAPPKTADGIVKRIRAIVDHGDLADEQYYAETLGVVMEGGAIGSMTEPDSPCGLMAASKREKMIEQRFYYKDVPWYFTSWFGRSRTCDRPYSKAFLSNGLIEVVGTLMVDAKKVCLTEDDLKKYFKYGQYLNERGGFKVKYSISGQNVISLEITSPSSAPRCAVYVNLYQNTVK